MTFAEKLKVLRTSRELTKIAVAKELGVNVHTYSSWEAGKTKPKTIEKLKRISEFYKISIKYLGFDEKTYNKSITKKKPVNRYLKKDILEELLNKSQNVSPNSLFKDISKNTSSKNEYKPSNKKQKSAKTVNLQTEAIPDDEFTQLTKFNKDEKLLFESMILLLNKYSQYGSSVNIELCRYFLTGKTWLSFIPETINKFSKIHIEKCLPKILKMCGFQQYEKNDWLIPYWIYPFLPKHLSIKCISSPENNPKTIEELIKRNIKYGNNQMLYVHDKNDTCTDFVITRE